MKTIHCLSMVVAIAALVPSACTDSFPAGVDHSASGGIGAGGADTGTGGVADAAVVATGGAPATGGGVGRGTGGVAGAGAVDADNAPAVGGMVIAGTGGGAGAGGAAAGGAPAAGGTVMVGTGGVAGAVGLDASAGGAAGSVTGGTSGCVPASNTSPSAMLPASNEIGGWALTAAPALINTDMDLYGMIDGAAPKYIDHRWVRSAYATYQQASGGSTLQVAVHDMGTAENANTLFDFDLPASRLALGPNAVLDMGLTVSYVARGWTGPYYVEVSLDDHSDAALVYVRTFVLNILNRVCSAVPDAGSIPDAPPA